MVAVLGSVRDRVAPDDAVAECAVAGAAAEGRGLKSCSSGETNCLSCPEYTQSTADAALAFAADTLVKYMFSNFSPPLPPLELEVVPPARTGIVVSDAPDPVANVPPARSPGSIFGNMDRNRLAALEAAAQRELAKGRRFGLGAGIFGRKR